MSLKYKVVQLVNFAKRDELKLLNQNQPKTNLRVLKIS